jgi:hypothetical protein
MHGKKLFWWLSQHSAICRAPTELNGIPTFGGGGDSNDGGAGDDDVGGGQQTPLIGQDGDDEPNPLNDALALFADPDDDDGNDDNGGTPPVNDVNQEQIAAMRTNVQNAINNMRITDDMIPQDFDANDRGQLTQVMNKLMQATIAQSMNVVFQPVQLAMKQMATTLQQQIKAEVNDSRTGMQDSAVLESIVPEINDPQYNGLVKTLDAQLKAKGKKAKERAQGIRKILNQMGIQSSGGGNNRRSSNPNNGANQSIKTGHAALDSFFGAFQPPKSGQNR